MDGDRDARDASAVVRTKRRRVFVALAWAVLVGVAILVVLGPPVAAYLIGGWPLLLGIEGAIAAVIGASVVAVRRIHRAPPTTPEEAEALAELAGIKARR